MATLKIVLISFFVVSIISGCSSRFSHSVNQVKDVQTERDLLHYSFDHTEHRINIPANPRYNKGWFYVLLFGEHYRNEWAAPVPATIIDITEEKEGLQILKKGGSRQTISLRLVDTAGYEYVIRSVDKFPASGLPEWLQESFFAYMINDATSAAHPYAALALPEMAKAINIYHTNPKLVYLPYDEQLGEYKDELGGMLALFEERPDGDHSESNFFGNSPRIVSTRKMMNDMLRDNDNYIDERFFLRSRIFDILIGDWSRHEDNWRWASFPEEKGYMYRAIPRDRDHAFFKFDGFLPGVVVKSGIKPHFRTFKHDIKNVVKLNRSGMNLDRLILPPLNRQAWIEITDSVKNELTDEVIERAVRAMPDTIFNMSGREIISKLKSRRDQLPEVMMEYYDHLHEIVTIVGTDKHERFDVEVLEDGNIKLLVSKIFKDGEVDFLMWEREYLASETNRIRIYGLDGRDRYYIKGNSKSKIKIELYGGADEDEYISEGNVSNIKIEDTPSGNDVDVTSGIKVKFKPNPQASNFDANGWLLRYYLYD